MTAAPPALLDVLHLHPADNVCLAVRDLEGGTTITAAGRRVTLAGRVRMGHKIAILPVSRGDRVVRYGQTIGFATCKIEPGDWVHVHNLSAGAFGRDYAFCSEVPPEPPPLVGRTFQGYRRADGRAGGLHHRLRHC